MEIDYYNNYLRNKMFEVNNKLIERFQESNEEKSLEEQFKIAWCLYENCRYDEVLKLSEEIENFLWYDSSCGTDILSNTLKHQVVPYCLSKKLIR